MIATNKNTLNDTVITHHHEVEDELLGAIFLDNENLDILIPIIKPKYFQSLLNKAIYTKSRDSYVKTDGVIPSQIAYEIAIEEGMERGANDAKNVNKRTEEILQYIMVAQRKAGLAFNSLESQAKYVSDLYAKRCIIKIGKEMQYKAINGTQTQSLEIIEEAESKLCELGIRDGYNKQFQSVNTLVEEQFSLIKNIRDGVSSVAGLSTGFREVDKILGGLHNSDLIILAGRPSMGKTALALNIILNICSDPAFKGRTAGFFSMEMSTNQLIYRLISNIAEVNLFKLRTSGDITDVEMSRVMKSVKKITELALFIDDSAGITVATIRARARRLARKCNLGVICIDYLQLIAGEQACESRTQEMSKITQGLKNIAKELNVPIIVLSQLSRATEQREDKRPSLSDLRDSGAIEQDADVVAFIFREEYYLRRSQPKEAFTEQHMQWQDKMNEIMNLSEVLIAKHRNGPVGNIKLWFDSDTVKFTDY